MKKMIKELMKINTRRGFRFENRKNISSQSIKILRKRLQWERHQAITEHIKIFVKCLIIQWMLKGGRNENRKILIS